MYKTQQRQDETSRHLQTLMNLLDVGLLALSEGLELDAANEPAWEMFDCHSFEELAGQWATVRRAIVAALGGAENLQALAGPLEIEIPAGEKSRRLRLEIYPLAGGPGKELVLLVRDHDAIEALEMDLDMATRYRTLATMFNSFAHDLRTPLNALAINLDLLKTFLAKNPPSDPAATERQQRYLKVLSEELDRLSHSLSAFLTQNQPAQEEEQVFDLHDLLRDLRTLIAPLAKKQKVSLEIHLQQQAIMLEGQRDKLKQALLNIAMNAFEAMPGGGHFTLRLETKPDRALIYFQDTGAGIPAEASARIWDLNYTTKRTGLGHGLFVSRSAIEAYGGSISLDERSGQGTCFIISLPISK